MRVVVVVVVVVLFNAEGNPSGARYSQDLLRGMQHA